MKLVARLWPAAAMLSFAVFSGGCFGGCDFDWGECDTDADCVGSEVCSAGWLGSACVEPECFSNEDCFCGEVCSDNFCESDDFDENPCPDEPECVDLGQICSFDTDCCSGTCDELEGCIESFPPGCVDLGQSCADGESCCGGVCADGLCAVQKCQLGGDPEIVAEGLAALGALGEDASTLYWVSEGALHSIPKVGGEPTLLASGAGGGGCISRFGNRTTWCGDGGEILRLSDGDEAPSVYALATSEVGSLVDSDAGLFWSESNGMIMAAAAPLPAPPQLLATATTASPPVVIDASSLFFADGGTVSAIPLGGGAISPLFTGVGPIEALGLDDQSLYFVDATAMTALGKTGGEPTAIGFAESARRIAVSLTDVFYADTFIAKIPKIGGETLTLVNAVAPPSLLVDDQCVYWVDAAAGRILKVSKN